LPPATRIETQDDLERLVDTLIDQSLIAIDTESNSLYAYQEQVCLIQLSTRSHDYIVDPLMIQDMRPLGKLTKFKHIEIVFHAAEYDIMCMKRDFGFEFNNLFDTMMAARICGIKLVGLGNLLKHYAGVTVDKSHQKDNWGKRPLAAESLQYAQMDTHYLPFLRDELYNELKSLGRLDEAAESFEAICDVPASTRKSSDPEGFWKIGTPNMLNATETLILRELYDLRESISQQENLPSFRVLSNKILVALSRSTPSTIAEVKLIKGISPRQIRKYGQDIISAIKRGMRANELPPPPRNEAPDSIIMDRYTALHLWRKERAIERGVESDVIITKQTLWDLAYSAPDKLDDLQTIKGLGPWRLSAYGEEILKVLDACRETEG
jgi:ribonuclease D